MHAEFWHDKWQRNDIAFHERKVNPFLVDHLARLKLSANSRVFLPLCGKTIDIAWLLNKGCRVAGAELSGIAIKELFRSLDLQPEVFAAGRLERYHAKNIDIFVGDIFDLDAEALGKVDAVFDRAALVALPGDTRKRYVDHLGSLTRYVPQLLVTFDYDQDQMSGPPFCVNSKEVMTLYGDDRSVKHLESKAVAGGLKGKVEAQEEAWLIGRAVPE